MTRARSLAVAALLLPGALAAQACATAGRPPSARSPAPLQDPVSGVAFLRVQGGCYQMGAGPEDCDATPEERPAHQVCVGDFWLGQFEVTQAQWRSVMGRDTAAVTTCAEDACPIDNVSFAEVEEYLARLNARGGGRYRLPTEAEWEFAARSGGKDEHYAGGNDLMGVSWYADNSGKINHPVGQKAPNGLGLHDMSGNVWEMTSDWYSAGYYAASPRDNPTGPAGGDDHVVRGGCRTGGPANQRTTRRTWVGDRTKGAGRGGNVGFRLLMVP